MTTLNPAQDSGSDHRAVTAGVFSPPHPSARNLHWFRNHAGALPALQPRTSLSIGLAPAVAMPVSWQFTQVFAPEERMHRQTLLIFCTG
jgi:hypothetical protein